MKNFQKYFNQIKEVLIQNSVINSSLKLILRLSNFMKGKSAGIRVIKCDFSSFCSYSLKLSKIQYAITFSETFTEWI